MIIGFEGIPGAGKSTSIELIRKSYHLPVVKEMLVDTATERAFTEEDYSEHDVFRIRHAKVLEKMYGHSLMDRTSYSTLAFRYALGRGSLHATPNPSEIPDHIVYLRIPAEMSIERRGAHGELWLPSHEFTQRVAEYYDLQFNNRPNATVIENLEFDPRGITSALSSIINARKL